MPVSVVPSSQQTSVPIFTHNSGPTSDWFTWLARLKSVHAGRVLLIRAVEKEVRAYSNVAGDFRRVWSDVNSRSPGPPPSRRKVVQLPG